MIYVDTNVFLDVLKADPKWHAWSSQQLELGAGEGKLVTGPIVLAELALHAETVEALEAIAVRLGARVEAWSLEASFHAGKAYLRYRAAGGTRATILADLLTGGHALALGATILTRDPRRFRAYFPDLPLIAPETGHG
jgi:predicted nucleic acid-binding protein